MTKSPRRLVNDKGQPVFNIRKEGPDDWHVTITTPAGGFFWSFPTFKQARFFVMNEISAYFAQLALYGVDR
jgi:hypothetical protein